MPENQRSCTVETCAVAASLNQKIISVCSKQKTNLLILLCILGAFLASGGVGIVANGKAIRSDEKARDNRQLIRAIEKEQSKILQGIVELKTLITIHGQLRPNHGRADDGG